ncbi:MAG: 3-oxoacyl-ACP reductase FabG [Clostridia bacterium]|nr:3-oxoacyl-ACP reductase FabG [Clostridia bacterium]
MRKIIVTGGSRGIGAAIVRKFAENGDSVVFLYRSNDRAAAEVGVPCIKGDIRDPKAVEKMISDAAGYLGGIDVLVNNAGIAQSALMGDISDADYMNMINTDLSGAFYCCRQAIPYFLRNHSGAIVNVSSMWGEVGASMEVHYSAAKAGLIGLTKALAKELGPSGVRVNCVTPGMIETDMNKGYSKEDVQAVIDETPLMRIGKPEDVAEAVFFLASDNASFITGQVLGVNGGYVIN